jgi:excisionase family DNA binding protein
MVHIVPRFGWRTLDMARTKGTPDERVVYDVPEAGRKLGMGRNAAYEAAARGEIPTIRIGKLLRVPKVAFDRMLEQAGRGRDIGK